MAKYISQIGQRKKIIRTDDIKDYEQKLENAKKDDSAVNKKVEDMSDKFDTAVLVFMGDGHIGVNDCDLDGMINAIEYVLNTPNAKLIMLGDFLNSAILNAISNMYEDVEYPRKQWKILVDLLKQVADQGKLTVFHLGNHCRRIFNQTGINVGEQAMVAVGCEDASAPYYAERVYKLKNGEIKSVTHHGDGVSNIFGVQKLSQINPASDINIVGHLHNANVYARTTSILHEDGKIYKQYCLDMIVGSSGDGDYGNIKMYDRKVTSPYTAVEVTMAVNPLYDADMDAKVIEPYYIPAFRSIPIRKNANTKQKSQQISLIGKVVRNVPQEKVEEINNKAEEIAALLESLGKYLTDEVRAQLILNYKPKKKVGTGVCNPVKIQTKSNNDNEYHN